MPGSRSLYELGLFEKTVERMRTQSRIKGDIVGCRILRRGGTGVYWNDGKHDPALEYDGARETEQGFV